jgi:cytochrome c biogenesis protein CcdA
MNPVLIAAVAVVIVAFLLFVISRVVRTRRRQASTPREDVPINLLPKTSLGRWSLGLAIALILLFVLAAGSLREQWGLDENGELVNPALTVVLTIILVTISGAALVTGLVSAIKRKDRSVLVFVGMIIAFWWGLLGAVGEFLI